LSPPTRAKNGFSLGRFALEYRIAPERGGDHVDVELARALRLQVIEGVAHQVRQRGRFRRRARDFDDAELAVERVALLALLLRRRGRGKRKPKSGQSQPETSHVQPPFVTQSRIALSPPARQWGVQARGRMPPPGNLILRLPRREAGRAGRAG
jgi:hypothetical protein